MAPPLGRQASFPVGPALDTKPCPARPVPWLEAQSPSGRRSTKRPPVAHGALAQDRTGRYRIAVAAGRGL